MRGKTEGLVLSCLGRVGLGWTHGRMDAWAQRMAASGGLGVGELGIERVYRY